jgi:hypothetical protein
LDQKRNDQEVLFESGGDLQPDEVLRVVEPSLSTGRRRSEPVLSDKSQEDPGRLHRLFDLSDEVDSGADRIDVDKDPVRSEPSAQSIVQSPRKAGGVVTPIGDEDV